MQLRRRQRLAETIREELEEIVNYELDDPRIGSVSVVEVVLSRDGRKAVARIDPAGSGAEAEAALAALDRAKGYVRRLLAVRLELFQSPEVLFEAAFEPGPDAVARRAPGRGVEPAS